MNKLQSLALLAALLTVALAPGTAVAAVRPYALTVSPSAGGYLFEGNQDLDDGLLYNLGLGYNFSKRWGVEGVASLVETETEAPLPQADVDLSSLRLDVLYHLRPDKAFVPYLAVGLGAQRLEVENGAAGHDDDGLVNYGLGFKLFFNDSVALRADVRHIINLNINDDSVDSQNDVFHNLAYSAGLLFQLGGAKETPRETPRPRDTDGDGVVDQFDRCPGTRQGVPVDGFGCPVDSDRDGVPDFLDKCPGTAAGVAVDPNGCPKEVKVPAPVDTDGDGVEDGRDRCPDTPAGVPVDANGCPKDSDGDGVFDFEDRCPGTPAGTAIDATGCPAPPPAAPAPASMTLELQFATGEAAIRPAFARDLQAAADFIKAHPEGRILVEGHTDSIGSVESNLALSKARAAEVRRALIENYTLEAARIETEGYGEARPVADNATPDGRMRNRRVVITVVPEH